MDSNGFQKVSRHDFRQIKRKKNYIDTFGCGYFLASVWYTYNAYVYDIIDFFVDFQQIASYYPIGGDHFASLGCFRNHVQKSDTIFCAPMSVFHQLSLMSLEQKLRSHVQLQLLSQLLNQPLNHPLNQLFNQQLS